MLRSRSPGSALCVLGAGTGELLTWDLVGSWGRVAGGCGWADPSSSSCLMAPLLRFLGTSQDAQHTHGSSWTSGVLLCFVNLILLEFTERFVVVSLFKIPVD